MDLATGIDLPGFPFSFFVLRFIAVFGSPQTNRVEIFQTKSDWIDFAMTAGALREFLVSPQAIARGEDFIRKSG